MRSRSRISVWPTNEVDWEKFEMLILRKLIATVPIIIALVFTAYSPASVAETCLWEGKAPACNGKCRPGYTLIKQDKRGDGKACLTGRKAYCCLTSDIIIRGTAPLCNGKCKVGEELLGFQNRGPNGKKCRTGKAAICRLAVK